MNIWLINPYGPIPGEGWRDYRFKIIGERLASEGWDVIWWTSSFSHHFKKQRCVGWEDKRISERFLLRLVPSPAYSKNVGVGRLWRDLVFGLRVYRRGLREAKPDLVIFYESPFCFGFAGYRLARAHAAKTIFDQMDLWPEVVEQALPCALKILFQPLFAAVRFSRAGIYRDLDGSIALCSYYLQKMHEVAPELIDRPSCVAFNGIDVGLFREAMLRNGRSMLLFSKRDDECWAIFAGSLGETYDIRTIVDASKDLAFRQSSIKLFVAGDGPLGGFVESSAKSDAREKLVFLGRLSTDQLLSVYNECDIGLCAYSERSNVEMPDKIYDYSAAGLAVVNSLRGEVASFINDYQVGVQYRAGDSRDLAQKLISLASNAFELTEMKRRSFELAWKFDKHLQMKRISEVVDAVIRGSDFVQGEPMGAEDELRVSRLSEPAIEAVVRIHLQAFPQFFLSLLGYRFLREFYRAFLNEKSAVAKVALSQDDVVLGSAIGTLEPAGFFKRLLLRRWWAFGFASLAALLDRPAVARRIVAAVFYRGGAENFEGAALLSSISVSPASQKKGVGRKLMQSWLEEVRRRGGKRALLTTDAEGNSSVNAFYRNCGWRLASTYTTKQGRRMNRYVIDI